MTEVAMNESSVTTIASSISGEVRTVQAPKNYSAAVILKKVMRNGDVNCFSVWIVAGRYGEGAVTLSYEVAADDLMVQVNIPTAGQLSIAYLQQRLEEWWRSKPKNGPVPDDTPIIIGSGAPGDPT